MVTSQSLTDSRIKLFSRPSQNKGNWKDTGHYKAKFRG